MSKTRSFRASIKHVFDLAMRDVGFDVDYPIYRRIKGETVDLVDLHHGNYGDEFQIEFARQTEPFHDWNNEVIAHEKRETVYISPLRHATLYDPTENKARNAQDFFEYSKVFDDRDALNPLMWHIKGYLPQIDKCLHTSASKPNVASF